MTQVYWLRDQVSKARIGWRIDFIDAAGTPRYHTWAFTQRGIDGAIRAWRYTYYRA
jgi:hypothetical protein